MSRLLRSLLPLLVVPLLAAGPPAKRARRPPQPPANVAAQDACTQSSDCTIFCPSAPNCCPSASCGCRSAINRGFVDKVQKEFAATCTRPPHCPAMGCAYEPAMSAQCVSGRCVASRGLSFP